jgi:hypothetical protein
LYAVAFVPVSSPLTDLMTTAWPPRFGDLAWRYGFLGLGAGYLNTPLMGLVLAMGVAYWRDHPTTFRLLGAVSLILAVALLPVLAIWPLDVQQIRALREAELRRGVAIAGVIQEIKYAGACLVLGALGIGVLGTARGNGGRGRASDAPGIVGRSRT